MIILFWDKKVIWSSSMLKYSRKANNKEYTWFFCIFEKLCLNNTKITHDALAQSCFPEVLLSLVCPYKEKGPNCGSFWYLYSTAVMQKWSHQLRVDVHG